MISIQDPDKDGKIEEIVIEDGPDFLSFNLDGVGETEASVNFKISGTPEAGDYSIKITAIDDRGDESHEFFQLTVEASESSEAEESEDESSADDSQAADSSDSAQSLATMDNSNLAKYFIT